MVRSKEMVEMIKRSYPEGTKVVCDYMEDMHGVSSGTKGTVMFVDDIGTVHVRWENGSSLGLIYGEDKFHIERDVGTKVEKDYSREKFRCGSCKHFTGEPDNYCRAYYTHKRPCMGCNQCWEDKDNNMW